MLAGSYIVERWPWDEYAERQGSPPSLIVLDVTHVTGDRVINLVSRLPVDVRVLIASLDRNEVDVYQIVGAGLAREGELPSLLALGA